MTTHRRRRNVSATRKVHVHGWRGHGSTSQHRGVTYTCMTRCTLCFVLCALCVCVCSSLSNSPNKVRWVVRARNVPQDKKSQSERTSERASERASEATRDKRPATNITKAQFSAQRSFRQRVGSSTLCVRSPPSIPWRLPARHDCTI